MSQFSERDYGDAEGLTKEERTRMFPQKNSPNQDLARIKLIEY